MQNFSRNFIVLRTSRFKVWVIPEYNVFVLVGIIIKFVVMNITHHQLSEYVGFQCMIGQVSRLFINDLWPQIAKALAYIPWLLDSWKYKYMLISKNIVECEALYLHKIKCTHGSGKISVSLALWLSNFRLSLFGFLPHIK